MKRSAWWPMLAAAVLFASTSIASEPGPSEIVVTGTGQAFAKADYGTMIVGVQARSMQAAGATGNAARSREAIVAALQRAGIAGRDIATVGYSVSQEFEYNERGVKGKMSGFLATHRIQVKVRDVHMLGQVVDASMGAGASDIASMEFKSADEDSAQHVALSQAVHCARSRAEIMADAAGGRLGRLIELTMEGAVRARGGVLSETLGNTRMTRYAIDSSTDITPMDKTVQVTVLGRWEFLSSSN